MEPMANHTMGIGIVALLGLMTVLGANWLNGCGVSPGLSRRVAGALGGLVFLVAILALEAAAAIILTFSIAVVIALLRWVAGSQLRGLRRNESGNKWGEVAYPLAGAASLALGWGLLGDRWLAFVPIGFMAWGDNAAGITRSCLSTGRRTSLLPSVVMLTVCLGVAFLYQPYWIAAAGALAAVIAERFRPTTHPIWDDNWTIVAAALTVMIALRR